MITIYVKEDNGQILKSLTKVDDTWQEVQVNSIDDEIMLRDNQFVPISSLDKLKQEYINELYKLTDEFIKKQYTDTKKDSDLSDENAFARWVCRQMKVTRDFLEDMIYEDVKKIIYGKSTFEEVVNNYPKEEYEYFYTKIPLAYALTQLLKIALRVSYVQGIKQKYYGLKQYIMSIDNIDKLIKINIHDLINNTYDEMPDYLK